MTYNVNETMQTMQRNALKKWSNERTNDERTNESKTPECTEGMVGTPETAQTKLRTQLKDRRERNGMNERNGTND